MDLLFRMFESANKEFEEEDTHRPVGCFTGLTVESFGQPSIVSRCRFECVALFLAHFGALIRQQLERTSHVPILAGVVAAGGHVSHFRDVTRLSFVARAFFRIRTSLTIDYIANSIVRYSFGLKFIPEVVTQRFLDFIS